ncbi:AMP-binding protein [Colwellia sp. RE-S-Sl-9]
MTNQITLPSDKTYFISQAKTFQQWSESVLFHRSLFIQNSAQTWLLYCEDAYEFSVLFFALLGARKNIVLPQNGTTNQLQTCLAHVQGVAGANELAFENTIVYQADGCSVNPEPLIIYTDTRVILFTSGSTGEAKAIHKEFSHLLLEVQQLEASFGHYLKDSGVVSTVSHQHIYGLLFKLIWPIWSGRNVILQPYEYPEHLCHDITKYSLDKVVLISSPAHFHRLIKDNVYKDHVSHISCMFSSGGPLSLEASLQLANELQQPPIEVFGSTETGGIAWRQRFSEDKQHWLAFKNIDIALDQESECLKIKSPYIIQPDWYLCDDRVNIISDNEFELCGRVDRIVKIEEKRVSLDHVQQCLKSIDCIDDAYCLTANNKRGTQVVAAIVLTEQAKAELKQSRNLVFNRHITSILHEDLEAIAIPKRFRYLEALPYNPSGKLNKKEMEKFFE